MAGKPEKLWFKIKKMRVTNPTGEWRRLLE